MPGRIEEAAEGQHADVHGSSTGARATGHPPLPQGRYRQDAAGPLQGIRVLDLSRLVAGNVLTQHLCDFGADVVKVEPTGGDTLRNWRVNGVETSWKLLSRSKRSLQLDFRHPGAMGLLRRLVPGASVLVESFRTGTLESMGLGPEHLLAIEPRLVIVRISGWGQDGPYKDRPGFGSLVEGFSGFASANGFADREPVLPAMYLADALAGVSGAFAVLAALHEVEAGGAGQVVDLSLLDPLFGALGPQAANYRLTGRVKERNGSRSRTAAPRNVYRTRDDRWVCLSASTQGTAHRLMRAIGRADLAADSRFNSNEARVENDDELDAIIGAFVAERTQAQNVSYFEKAKVTVGPVYDIGQLMSDPHVHARGLLSDYPDGDMDYYPMPSIPVRLSRTPGDIRAPAPRLGQHTRAVLAGAGYTPAEVQELLDSGVAGDDHADEPRQS